MSSWNVQYVQYSAIIGALRLKHTSQFWLFYTEDAIILNVTVER